MGAVYRARHVRTGRRYAVKVMPQASQLDPDLVRRFRREAELLASLGHAGLVAVHDFDVDTDGTAYMVMDCLSGEDVAARIEREGAMEPKAALKVARQVASALEAAHAAGVLHRDLKPANIFLQTQAGAEERAVLLDFGIAKIMEHGDSTRLTQTGATIGTPGYMSPEQARAEELDVRSDVYSLGCVVYEMLCGAAPFDGPTITAILAKVLTEEPPRPSSVELGLPSAVDEVLAKALSKKRDERYLTPSALVRDLENVFAGHLAAPSARALARTELSSPNVAGAVASSVVASDETNVKELRQRRIAIGAGLGLIGLVAVMGASYVWVKGASTQDVENAVDVAQDDDIARDHVAAADQPPPEVHAGLTNVPSLSDAALTPQHADAGKAQQADVASSSGRVVVARKHRRPKHDSTQPTTHNTPEPTTTTTVHPSMAGQIETMKKHLAQYESLQGLFGEYRKALAPAGGRAPAICTGGLSERLHARARAMDAPGVSQSVGAIHNQIKEMCGVFEKIDNPPPEAELLFKKARRELDEAARAVASAQPGAGIDAADLSKLKRTISSAQTEIRPGKRFACGSSNFRVLEAFVQVIEDRDLMYAVRDAHYAQRDACNSLGWASAEPRRSALVQTVDAMQSSYRQAAQSYRDSIRNMGG